MPNNLFVSFMRTLVPLVAALVLGTAARWGWDLDDAAVTSYVTLGLAAVYYLVFRVLEAVAERMAWQPLQTLAGLLLGWAKPPQYVSPVTAPLRFKLDMAGADQEFREFLKKALPDSDEGRR